MSFGEPVYDFKVGDRCAYYFRGDLAGVRVITKITPSGMFLRTNKGDSFRQGSGALITGDSYHYGSIVPLTDALRDKLTHMRLSNLMAKYDWKQLSLGKLRAIMNVIDGNEPA